ncbi:Clavaminate synthase-like protein [Penicillium lividum]|nr:Clavaminate synthase-like protein [Penicillium lividum]
MNVERLSHLLSATAAALLKPHFGIAIPPDFIKSTPSAISSVASWRTASLDGPVWCASVKT